MRRARAFSRRSLKRGQIPHRLAVSTHPMTLILTLWIYLRCWVVTNLTMFKRWLRPRFRPRRLCPRQFRPRRLCPRQFRPRRLCPVPLRLGRISRRLARSQSSSTGAVYTLNKWHCAYPKKTTMLSVSWGGVLVSRALIFNLAQWLIRLRRASSSDVAGVVQVRWLPLISTAAALHADRGNVRVRPRPLSSGSQTMGMGTYVVRSFSFGRFPASTHSGPDRTPSGTSLATSYNRKFRTRSPNVATGSSSSATLRIFVWTPLAWLHRR